MELAVLIVILAFACELVDSSLGMGYGTTLTPLLLLMGYKPVEVVPAVLISECVTGILAGFAHHELGNVDLRPDTRDFKVTLVLSGLSVVGVLLGVGIAVNIPSWAVKAYIGVLVLIIGLTTLKNHRREIPFSWKRIAGLGLLAAFNKGISGGGYGPVVTGGQVLSGIRGRSAVGIASLAEGVTSAVGTVAYLCSGAPFPSQLAPSLLLGATLSVPISAYVVSRLPAGRLTLLIGSLSTGLGAYTLARVVMAAI
jgi:uncharacterized membrane protein YfcA